MGVVHKREHDEWVQYTRGNMMGGCDQVVSLGCSTKIVMTM